MMPQQPLGTMTSSPLQQISSVIAARDFLVRLATPSVTPRLHREIRAEARILLRHFPPADQLRPALEAALQRRAAL